MLISNLDLTTGRTRKFFRGNSKAIRSTRPINRIVGRPSTEQSTFTKIATTPLTSMLSSTGGLTVSGLRWRRIPTSRSLSDTTTQISTCSRRFASGIQDLASRPMDPALLQWNDGDHIGAMSFYSNKAALRLCRRHVTPVKRITASLGYSGTFTGATLCF